MAKASKCDGAVNTKEINVIESYIDEADSDDRPILRQIYREAKDDNVRFERIIEALIGIYDHKNDDFFPRIINVIERICLDDGSYNEQEIDLISRIIKMTGGDPSIYWSRRNSDGSKRKDEKSLIEEAYKALGLRSGCSYSDVLSAYRTLSMKFHPDKIASKDLDQEFIRFAEGKFSAISEAYKILQKHLQEPGKKQKTASGSSVRQQEIDEVNQLYSAGEINAKERDHRLKRIDKLLS